VSLRQGISKMHFGKASRPRAGREICDSVQYAFLGTYKRKRAGKHTLQKRQSVDWRTPKHAVSVNLSSYNCLGVSLLDVCQCSGRRPVPDTIRFGWCQAPNTALTRSVWSTDTQPIEATVLTDTACLPKCFWRTPPTSPLRGLSG
jgi:hypothetical protein